MSNPVQNLRLSRLTLSHFKGIDALTLRFDGLSGVIAGANGSGKTTVVDAVQWLLFGKDSAHRKDFGIKRWDAHGEPRHNLTHTVEAVLSVDGRALTLKKSFAEKWTKKRGQATAEFTGHTTEHAIDGVPLSEKEYTATIAALMDEAVFRLLTSPTYFNERLSWQDRRQLLLRVVGELDDATVIAANPILADLPKLLDGRALDDHRKVVESRRRQINQELAKIPVRIDEATRSLPTEGEEPPPGDLTALRETLSARQTARQDHIAQGPEAERRRRVIELRDRLHERGLAVAAIHAEAVAALQQAARDSHATWADQTAHLDQLQRSREATEAELADLASQMTDKRLQWRAVHQETFEAPEDTVCAACGQDLPPEAVTDASAKARASFHQSKSERLERIQQDGLALKAQHSAAESRHAAMVAEQSGLAAAVADLRKAMDEDRARAAAAQDESPNLMGDPDYHEIWLAQRTLLESPHASEEAEGLTALDAEIAGLTEHIAALEASQARAQQTATIRQRIADLGSEEKTLAAEFEGLERQLYLLDQFTRTKVDALESRINAKFAGVSFKLFHTLVNGALEETAITQVNGVPYPDLNYAAKIQAGLTIIGVLSHDYGFTAPVFIDSQESVSTVPNLPTQVIRLRVDPAYPALVWTPDVSEKGGKNHDNQH